MKILVADDESTPALFLRRTLERLGHEVVVASNGLEAWERLQADAFRLVITDWMMPGLDGLDLCRRIRGRGDSSYIYIILLTAREGLQDRLAGLTAGADDFLSKPMDPAELAARVGIAGRIVAMQEELERKNVQLAELATTDGLTGLKNRRCFDEALTTACSFAVRCGYPLSLMMFDVDHFKTLNDSFGTRPVIPCWQRSPRFSGARRATMTSWPGTGAKSLPSCCRPRSPRRRPSWPIASG